MYDKYFLDQTYSTIIHEHLLVSLLPSNVLYQVYLMNSVCYLYVHMSQNKLFNFPKSWPEMITFFQYIVCTLRNNNISCLSTSDKKLILKFESLHH